MTGIFEPVDWDFWNTQFGDHSHYKGLTGIFATLSLGIIHIHKGLTGIITQFGDHSHYKGLTGIFEPVSLIIHIIRAWDHSHYKGLTGIFWNTGDHSHYKFGDHSHYKGLTGIFEPVSLGIIHIIRV